MDKHAPGLPSTVLAATLAGALVVLASPVIAAASPNSSPAVVRQGTAPVVVVQAEGEGEQPRELQPRYEPVPPQPRSTYNDEYIFGLTRSVADSTMHPAAKILLFPITVPFDLVFLPFEAIGGLFPK